MSVVHQLKTLPVYFDAVERGEKTFEVRRDDRGFQKGDVVRLLKLTSDAKLFYAQDDTPDEMLYPPRGFRPDGKPLPQRPKPALTDVPAFAQSIERRISWILTDGFAGLQPGYIVLALSPVDPSPSNQSAAPSSIIGRG